LRSRRERPITLSFPGEEITERVEIPGVEARAARSAFASRQPQTAQIRVRLS
jgi:hypothetical protein